MNFKNLWQALALAAACTAPAAHAELVFSDAELGAGVLVQAFDVADAALMDTHAARMQIGASLGVDLGVSATDGQINIGSNAGIWGLGSNGGWTDTTVAGVDSTFLAINGTVDFGAGTFATLSFDFGSQAVSAVGAFMSYDPDFSYMGQPTQLYLAAYDASGMLIEDYQVPVEALQFDEFGDALPNQGAFYGIKVDSPRIARLDISAPYAVVDNFSFTAPVPEPATWGLMLGGVAVLAAARRRAA